MYTMTKEDAKKILADLIDNPFLHTWEEQNKALHMAIEALQDDWIPVSEKLPREKQEVYVTVYFTEGDTGRAYGYINGFGNWHLYSTVEGTLFSGYEVVAWMPLPTPYKAESEDKE